MVLSLIMKTENNFKQEKMLKLLAAQVFEAGDFVNIFLRF